MVAKTESADIASILKASKVMSAAIAMSLDGSDREVTLRELRTLNMISAQGPMKVTALAEGLGVNPSNASRVADDLVARGLLERREDAEDRRRVVLRLTRPGRRAVDRMMKHRQAVLEQIVDRMSADDQLLLGRALRAFGEAADQLTDEGKLLSDGEGHLLRWLG